MDNRVGMLEHELEDVMDCRVRLLEDVLCKKQASSTKLYQKPIMVVLEMIVIMIEHEYNC